MSTPTSPWLPSEWASEALLSHLNGVFDPFPFLLLWSTAAAFVQDLHRRVLEEIDLENEDGVKIGDVVIPKLKLDTSFTTSLVISF